MNDVVVAYCSYEKLYQAMYEAIVAHSRLGLNVVVDVGHHDFQRLEAML